MHVQARRLGRFGGSNESTHLTRKVRFFGVYNTYTATFTIICGTFWIYKPHRRIHIKRTYVHDMQMEITRENARERVCRGFSYTFWPMLTENKCYAYINCVKSGPQVQEVPNLSEKNPPFTNQATGL